MALQIFNFFFPPQIWNEIKMVLNVPRGLCWMKGYRPNKGCDLDRVKSQGQGQGKVGCAPQLQPPSKAGHLRRRLTCISITFYSFFNFWEMIIHFLFTRPLMLLNHGIISFFLSWINTDPNAVLFLWYIWRAQKKKRSWNTGYKDQRTHQRILTKQSSISAFGQYVLAIRTKIQTNILIS